MIKNFFSAPEFYVDNIEFIANATHQTTPLALPKNRYYGLFIRPITKERTQNISILLGLLKVELFKMS